MNKKVGLKSNKLPLLVLVIVLLMGLGMAGAYQAGVNSSKENSKSASNKNGSLADDPDPEHLEARESQSAQIFENYKKQIAEGKASGIDKMTLYINAAITGASVDAPEAKEYAKEALNLMTPEMKNDARSKDLIDKMQKISEGKYSEVRGQ